MDTFDEETTKEGVQIMEEILRSWAGSTDGIPNGQDDDDIEMGDETMSDEAYEAELKKLVDVIQSHRGKIEGNAWLKDVVQSLR